MHTKSSGGATFQTKVREYKFAESTFTAELRTPKTSTFVSQYFAKNTNLLLLAVKTKSWGIARAILGLNPEKYPRIFKVTPGQNHPLYHLDASKANCLYMAIEDEQIEIIKMILDIIDN